MKQEGAYGNMTVIRFLGCGLLHIGQQFGSIRNGSNCMKEELNDE
jgi:hypothetical protein